MEDGISSTGTADLGIPAGLTSTITRDFTMEHLDDDGKRGGAMQAPTSVIATR
jgi:hypothetical protein